MNSLERFSAAIKLLKPDRIPLAYQFFGAANHVLRKLNISLRDVYYSSKGVTAFQLKALELYGHDNVMMPGGCCNVEAEAMGAEIQISENNYPKITGRSIQDLKDLKPADPYKAGRMPIYLESIGLLSDKLEGSTPIIGMILGPLGVLIELLGFTKIIIDIRRNPDIVHEAMGAVTETCIAYGEAMMKEGAHGIMLDEAGASASIMSPDMCSEFGIQYSKQLMTALKAAGGFVIIHNCSENPYLELQVDMQPDVLCISGGNLKEIKERFGRHVCLMGNIDPDIMYTHSVSEVKSKVIELFEAAKNEGGFILSTGCEIPHMTPIANMNALKETVEQYGSY